MYIVVGPFQINIFNKQFAIRSIIYVPIFVIDTYKTFSVKKTQHIFKVQSRLQLETKISKNHRN